MSIFKDIDRGFKKVGKEIRGGVKKPIRDVDRGFDRAGREIADGVRRIEETAQRGVRDVERAAERAAESVAEEIPEVLENIAEELQEAIGGKVGDVIFGIADHIAPGKTKQGIGFLEFEVEVRDKLPAIRQWIADPPNSARDVERMVRELTDDDVIILRPAKIPGLPYLGIDPRIPVKVEDLPDIVERMIDQVRDVL